MHVPVIIYCIEKSFKHCTSTLDAGYHDTKWSFSLSSGHWESLSWSFNDHIVPIHDDLDRVIVEEVRDESVEVSVPTSEVKVLGEALRIFIACPTCLIKVI